MASSIVKSIAQQLGNLLVEEAKSLYKVKDKIESLQKDLEWMEECFLRDADSRLHQDRAISKWVSEVRDLAYDAEHIIERYLYDVSHHRRDGVQNTLKWVSRLLSTCDAYTLHNLSSDIDGLKIKQSDLRSRLDMCGLTRNMPTSSMKYNTKIMEERRTYSHTEENVVGLVKDIQQVVDQLVNPDVKVVGISGIGGLGKTTLARKVFKHKDIKDHFNDNCAWVYISKEFERGNIFQQILLELEKGEEAKKRIKNLVNVEKLPEELHKVLQERRCLVAVDDIWTEKDWESLKPGFESACATTSASKILFTTRKQDLLQHFNAPGYLHPLNPLSDEESWELLKRKAFIGYGRTDEDQVNHGGDDMVELGREMLKHCGGLPIAIVALGGILSSKKTISEWKEVRDIFRVKRVGDGDLTLKVLDLSYHDLPFYLKPCFLYLGSFPEDYKIITQRLYHLWQAEGFLEIKSGETSYGVGEGYLNELVQRSMVQVGEWYPSGRIKTCRVHDVMRDMCLRKCEEVGFLNYTVSSESDSVSTLPGFSVAVKKLRRCVINDENAGFFEEHFKHREGDTVSSIRSLLVFRSQEWEQKAWKSCPLLRVLDVQGMERSRFVGFIDGVGDLSHLRYLNMRESRVKVLPSCLYDLKYLETLDLRSNRWESLKLKNKFDTMNKLRHLYLPRSFEVEGGERLKFPNDGLQMETLKNFDPKRCETTQLIRMTKLRVFSICRDYTFEKVEELKRVLMAPVMKEEGQLINSFRLEIKAGVIEEECMVLSSVARHPFIKELVIKGSNESPSIIIIGVVFPETLTWVKLSNCIIGEGEVFALEKLPHLKFLSLFKGVVGNKLSFSASSFPQLCVLSISYPRGLEKWEVGEGALPNLQSLYLTGCDGLEWEVRKGALPNLQLLDLVGSYELKVNNFPQSLTEVKLESCDIEEGGSLLSALENLPRLNSLQISCLYPDGGAGNNRLSVSPRSFPQVTQLRLTGLAGLEFGDDAFPSLQYLKLCKCNELNKVTNIPNSLTQVGLLKCEIGVSLLAELENLPCLKELFINEAIPVGIDQGGNRLNFSPVSFPHLTEFSFSGMGFQMCFSPGSFPKLAKLYICDESGFKDVKLGFSDGALPNLQRHLDFYGCFPNSLTHLSLNWCVIREAGGDFSLSALENLPHLHKLTLYKPIIQGEGNKLSFSAASLPQLRELEIYYAEELEIGDGALPNLLRLSLFECRKLKRIPSNLPDSIDIDIHPPLKPAAANCLRFKLMSCLH